jgi:hypothetical protein
MKHLLLVFIFLGSALFSQSEYAKQVFSNAQGIEQTEATFFEVEGYEIFVKTHTKTFDEKGISKVKRIYSIPSWNIGTKDSTLKDEYYKYYVDIDSALKTVPQSNIYYFIRSPENQIKVIGLRTIMKRDIELERFFVKAIVDNAVPKQVYTPMKVDTILFAGRKIDLGAICRWMGTHNLQCDNMGQMNWAEFRKMEQAEEMVAKQKEIIANKPLSDIKANEEVAVIFEGKEVKAKRCILKVNLPKVATGGYNVLIIYFVAAEVRGKYVGCVLSHYTDDIIGTKLPPLLKEVMKLKE